jgi:ABC-2 type transport system permease protein
VSRYSIVIGKIVGESTVSFLLILSIIILGIILGVPINWLRFILILPLGVFATLLGGAFGVLIMANISGQQAAQQVFPFVIFPQIFLSGVFNPILNLPPVLMVLSRISPMTYAVDFIRGLYYLGQPEYSQVVLHSPLVNLAIMTGYFLFMLILGTRLFVSRERNR